MEKYFTYSIYPPSLRQSSYYCPVSWQQSVSTFLDLCTSSCSHLDERPTIILQVRTESKTRYDDMLSSFLELAQVQIYTEGGG